MGIPSQDHVVIHSVGEVEKLTPERGKREVQLQFIEAPIPYAADP